MKVADLFVSIGITGTDKTVSALVQVEKGLSQVGSMSLEAKAAIVAAGYALEQLFSKSGQAGTDLTNFNAILGGQSIQTLQQYQYAARQVGVSNEETASTFKTLQKSMSDIALGKGGSAALGQLALTTGPIDPSDIKKFTEHPELLLQKLQEYAKKEHRVGIRNDVLKSFGLSDNLVAAVSQNTFNPTNLKKAPTYSDKEVGNLNKANIAWSNLNNTVQMAIGKLNASHGQELVKDFNILVTVGLKFADILLKIAEKAKVFNVIKLAFSGIESAANAVLPIVGKIGDYIGEMGKNLNVTGALTSLFDNLKAPLQDVFGFVKKLSEAFTGFGTDTGAFQKFGEVLSSIASTFGNLVQLATTFTKTIYDLLSAMQVFQTIGQGVNMSLEGWKGIFQGVSSILDTSTGGLKQLDNFIKGSSPSEETPKNVNSLGAIQKISNISKEEQGSVPLPGIFQNFSNEYNLKNHQENAPISPAVVSPETAAPNISSATSHSVQNQNINLNQNISVSGDTSDYKKTGDAMKAHVQRAARQISAQLQGT